MGAKGPTYEVDEYGNIFYTDNKGRFHCKDGPAVNYADGYKAWFITGKLHRLDGPAVEWASGSKEWWVGGKRHRLDGPAVELVSGYKEWRVGGKLHRLDGPAVEWASGSKFWWVEGERMTEEEFKSLIKTTSREVYVSPFTGKLV